MDTAMKSTFQSERYVVPLRVQFCFVLFMVASDRSFLRVTGCFKEMCGSHCFLNKKYYSVLFWLVLLL